MTGSPTPGKGEAFTKGGFGCLLLFAAIAALTLIFGGRVRVDIGGIILLFVAGGIIGLIVRFIYNKGRRDRGDR